MGLFVESEVVEGPEEHMTEEEVHGAIQAMKSRKVGGPKGLVGDTGKAPGSWDVIRNTWKL